MADLKKIEERLSKLEQAMDRIEKKKLVDPAPPQLEMPHQPPKLSKT